MDGLTDCVPFDEAPKETDSTMDYSSMDLDDEWAKAFADPADTDDKQKQSRLCTVMDWENNAEATFHSIKEARAYGK